ncbi:MAG: hypothetical protein KDK41_11780 [Leptospiraceae bacterium]|nr:hypothetical protein [Leptospiraceae bacterium]
MSMSVICPLSGADYVPLQNTEDSIWKVTAYDLLIPGYGAFYYGKPYWGAAYATGKLAGAAMIFMAVRNYNYWQSVQTAASRVPGAVLGAGETSPAVFLANPANSDQYLSPREIQNKVDEAFLLILYASLFEVAVYGFSAWHTWDLGTTQALKNGPLYRFGSEDTEVRIDLGWQQSY